MERREFLGWVGTGAIATCLPVAIAACTPSGTGTTDPTTDTTDTTGTTQSGSGSTDSGAGDGFVAVGSVTELDEKGFLYDKQANIMVVRHQEAIMALNPKCTHQQCPVEWESSSSTLSCPCHGSEFATDGSVITGPASTPLAQYEFQEEDGMVKVKPA